MQEDAQQLARVLKQYALQRCERAYNIRSKTQGLSSSPPAVAAGNSAQYFLQKLIEDHHFGFSITVLSPAFGDLSHFVQRHNRPASPADRDELAKESFFVMLKPLKPTHPRPYPAVPDVLAGGAWIQNFTSTADDDRKSLRNVMRLSPNISRSAVNFVEAVHSAQKQAMEKWQAVASRSASGLDLLNRHPRHHAGHDRPFIHFGFLTLPEVRLSYVRGPVSFYQELVGMVQREGYAYPYHTNQHQDLVAAFAGPQGQTFFGFRRCRVVPLSRPAVVGARDIDDVPNQQMLHDLQDPQAGGNSNVFYRDALYMWLPRRGTSLQIWNEIGNF
eukprot:GSA120T00006346001.1